MSKGTVVSWVFTGISIFVWLIREWWSLKMRNELVLIIQTVKDVGQSAITKDDNWKEEQGDTHARWQSFRSTIDAIIRQVDATLVHFGRKPFPTQNDSGKLLE